MKIFKSTGLKTSPCAVSLYMNLGSEMFATIVFQLGMLASGTVF